MRALLLFFIVIANCSFAQSKNDPLLRHDDGLPAVSPRDVDVEENERIREDYQPSRQPIAGTINRTDEEGLEPLEYRSVLEAEEEGRHFRNDTTRIRVPNISSSPANYPAPTVPDTSGAGSLRSPTEK